MKAIEKLRERKHAEWSRESWLAEQMDSDELARQLPRYTSGSGALH